MEGTDVVEALTVSIAVHYVEDLFPLLLMRLMISGKMLMPISLTPTLRRLFAVLKDTWTRGCQVSLAQMRPWRELEEDLKASSGETRELPADSKGIERISKRLIASERAKQQKEQRSGDS